MQCMFYFNPQIVLFPCSGCWLMAPDRLYRAVILVKWLRKVFCCDGPKKCEVIQLCHIIWYVTFWRVTLTPLERKGPICALSSRFVNPTFMGFPASRRRPVGSDSSHVIEYSPLIVLIRGFVSFSTVRITIKLTLAVMHMARRSSSNKWWASRLFESCRLRFHLHTEHFLWHWSRFEWMWSAHHP